MAEKHLILTEEQKSEIIEKVSSYIEKEFVEMDVDSYGEYEEEERDCDSVEVEGLYIYFIYSIGCRYREWTETWYDPYCTPSCSETDMESASILSINIEDEEDGLTVASDVIAEILKAVEKKIETF